MDARHFDRLVKSLHSRRAAFGLAAIGALFGSPLDDEAQAKRRKKCGPCRRRRRGKCRPKPDDTPCGDCSLCRNGRCRVLCTGDACAINPDGFDCLLPCDPPCDTCSFCDQFVGECGSFCPGFCINEFCRQPCDPPCGPCAVCSPTGAGCSALCPEEQCDAGLCDIPCDPECETGEECTVGACYPTCEPACASDEACVNGECINTARDCPDEPGPCFVEGNVRCFEDAGHCVRTFDGDLFCAQPLDFCVECATHLDCQNWGLGPNSRCVADCELCPGSGGQACVKFAGDAGN
jgi:hypothetical protein